MKFISALAIFVLILSFAQAHAADLAPWGALNPSRGPELPYEPDLKAFPKELSPLVSLIDSLPLAADSDTTLKQRTHSIILKGESLATSLQSTLSRGYHDELYQLLGILYERGHLPEQALNAYQSSLSLHPNNPAVLFRHAYLLRELGKCDQAVPELREVTWLSDSYRAEVMFISAQCLITQGSLVEAQSTLEDARKLKPALFPITDLLLRTRLALLDHIANSKARDEMEAKIAADLTTLVKQEPDNDPAAIMLASYLLEHSNSYFDAPALHRAEKLASNVVSKSKYSDEEAVKILAYILVKQNKMSAALKTIREGLAKNPESASLLAASKQIDSLQPAATEPLAAAETHTSNEVE